MTTITNIESAKARVETLNAEAAAANARYMDICERGFAYTAAANTAAEDRRRAAEAAAQAMDELDALLDAQA